jgi:hypothetical protein
MKRLDNLCEVVFWLYVKFDDHKFCNNNKCIIISIPSKLWLCYNLHLWWQLFLWFWSSNSVALPKQVVYHLGHTPGSFSFTYFSYKVSCFLPWPTWIATLLLRTSHIAGITETYYQLIGWDEGLTNFLSELASGHDPSDLCLLSNWDCRHKPLHLSLNFIF